MTEPATSIDYDADQPCSYCSAPPGADHIGECLVGDLEAVLDQLDEPFPDDLNDSDDWELVP